MSRDWTSAVSPITAEMSSCDRLASGHQRRQYDYQPERCVDGKGLGSGARRGQVLPEHLDFGRVRQGIYNVANDHPNRLRFIAARDGLADRFVGRTLSVGGAVVRRWGVISGTTKRATG